MDIESLKQNLTNVMPILDANLAASNREYMAGDIAKGAFHYVLTRHGSALTVLARNDLEVKAAFLSCAMLAIDLRTGLNEAAFEQPDAQAQAHAHVDAWWQCYRDAGFTEVNKLFGTPMLPTPTTADDHVERFGTTAEGKTQAFNNLQDSALTANGSPA